MISEILLLFSTSPSCVLTISVGRGRAQPKVDSLAVKQLYFSARDLHGGGVGGGTLPNMLSGRRACGERGWIIMLMRVPPALSQSQLASLSLGSALL